MQIIVMNTCPSKAEAKTIARGLVEQRLAACVQMMPISSCYSWQGQINLDDEILLLIKAPEENYAAIESFILEHHSYDVPEIIKTPITGGSSAYLSWIESSCLD